MQEMIDAHFFGSLLLSHFWSGIIIPMPPFHCRWTRVGPLSSSNIDLSVNAYGHTGHLLCHDDVIGSRRVSQACLLPYSFRGGDGMIDKGRTLFDFAIR